LTFENENEIVYSIHKFLIEIQCHEDIELDSDDLYHILKEDFDYVRKQYNWEDDFDFE